MNAFVYSLAGVAGSFREASPIAINEDQNVATNAPEGEHERLLQLHLYNRTVSDALSAVVPLVDPEGDYHLSKDAIDLSPGNVSVHADRIGDVLRELGPDLERAVYLQGLRPRTPMRFAPVRLGAFVSDLVSEFSSETDPHAVLFGDRLIAIRTPRKHAALHKSLLAFLAASPAGSPAPGPAAQPTDLVSHTDLEQRIPELELSCPNMVVALDTLCEQTHANVVIDWKSMEDIGVNWRRPVRLHLWDTTLRWAIDAIFSSCGYGGAVTVSPAPGIILISGRSETSPLDVRVYDARDLISQISEFDKSKGPPQPALTTNNLGPTQVVAPPGIVQAAINSLIDTIERSVAPDTWADNGATSAGTIHELGGRLIVAQTPRVHHLLAQFLRTLRVGGSKEGMRIQDAPQTAPSTP